MFSSKKALEFRQQKGWFGKDERKKIISDVCHVNRVIFDVSETVGQVVHVWTSPTVDIGEDKVDPLRDERVAKVLRKQGMEHCCVTPWSFGEHGPEGEEGHKLKFPCAITTNSSGQFIVGVWVDSKVKVFDSTGTFIKLFSLPNGDADTKLCVLDVATDMKDNIYVLVRLDKPGAGYKGAVYELNNTADLQHKFPVRGWGRLTVTDSGKVLVLSRDVVHVHEADGEFVREFGEGILKYASDITAANDGRVMIVAQGEPGVRIFSEHGEHLSKFKLQGCYSWPSIAFHRASEHVVVADIEEEKDLLHVDIYTKDGEFVRGTQTHEEGIDYLGGITVTTEGRIAVACRYNDSTAKVLGI